jgi:protein O-mannosyl-transferase
MFLNITALCRRPIVAIPLILLAGIAVYANTFHVPFVFDDARSIIENPVIKNLANFYANSSGYDYLPNRVVAFLSFALNYHFGGLAVFGYHAVNLIIHLVTAVLVYTLLDLTFRAPYFQGQVKGPESGAALASNYVPLFAALLFVVHPVQTQAVTYVVQRLTSLTALFYLLSVVLYVKARLSLDLHAGFRIQHTAEETGSRFTALSGPETSFQVLRVCFLMAGSVIAAVLAMKTKEIAFTLPLAILLHEACFFRGAWKRRLVVLLPLLATLFIVPLTVLALDGSVGDILSDTGEQLRVQSGISRLDYLFTQFRVIATYLRLLILPVNQNLDYDYPLYTSFLTPPVILSFLLLLAFFTLAVYLFWRTRYGRMKQIENESALRLIAFGIVWFFLTLSVESSVIPIKDVIMEHRLYLPGFGAATAFATTLCLLAGKIARPAGGTLLLLGASLLVLTLGVATYQRNHVWGDSIRLWQDVVEKSPNNGRANNNLGVALEAVGRRPDAFKALSRAISVDPDYYRSYYNLADLYLVSDQPDKAIPLLQTALQLRSDFTEAYVELGAALMREGRFREMITFLEQNLDRVKGNAEAHFYLGSGYAFTGNREAAMRELAIVSRLDQALAANLAGMLGLNAPHGHK